MFEWLKRKRKRKELPEYSALRSIPSRGVPPDLAEAEQSKSFVTSRENFESELRKSPRRPLGDNPLFTELLETNGTGVVTTTLQVRLEEDVRHNLDKYAEYAEFLDANSSYVVSEGLKFLFRKDKEFMRWLGQHANNPVNERRARKGTVSNGESIQLEFK